MKEPCFWLFFKMILKGLESFYSSMRNFGIIVVFALLLNWKIIKSNRLANVICFDIRFHKLSVFILRNFFFIFLFCYSKDFCCFKNRYEKHMQIIGIGMLFDMLSCFCFEINIDFLFTKLYYN